MVLVDVRACSQMEDRRNQLVQGHAKLDALLIKLEQEQAIAVNPIDYSSECVENLSRQISSQKGIVKYLKSLVDEGNTKFERIHKKVENVHSNLIMLE
jgi:hypothetical protein